MTPPKILIVDDEPFNVDYLEQELEDLDYQTISASNGEQAMEKVQSEQPDLVLLDIMMPVMDGFQVLSILKADPATRDIPVIVISAANSLDSVVKGIQLGAEDYLPKPFEPVLLKARISTCLEKKRLHNLEQQYRKGLERELDIGREIQLGFLPESLPAPQGWEIAAYFKAAREVAGDFYDSFLLPDGSLVCVVGDVCGKGVGAALFMTLFRSLIRITASTDNFLDKDCAQEISAIDRLNHIVSFTNTYIVQTHADAKFTTAFIGIINPASGALAYVNCGNEPPVLLRRGGAVVQLQTTGSIIGIFPDLKFTVQEELLENEDILFAFTDGIPDSVNPLDEFYGRERLKQLLDAHPSSPAGLLEDIRSQLSQFTGAASQFDDITMLAIKRTA